MLQIADIYAIVSNGGFEAGEEQTDYIANFGGCKCHRRVAVIVRADIGYDGRGIGRAGAAGLLNKRPSQAVNNIGKSNVSDDDHAQSHKSFAVPGIWLLACQPVNDVRQ